MSSIPLGRVTIGDAIITHRADSVFRYENNFLVTHPRGSRWFAYNARPRWYHRFVRSWAERYWGRHGGSGDEWHTSAESAFAAAVRFARLGPVVVVPPPSDELAAIVGVEVDIQTLTEARP